MRNNSPTQRRKEEFEDIQEADECENTPPRPTVSQAVGALSVKYDKNSIEN